MSRASSPSCSSNSRLSNKSNDVTDCQICSVRFNKLSLRFKYSCRVCGWAVCGKCSSKQAVTDGNGRPEWLRVCTKCVANGTLILDGDVFPSPDHVEKEGRRVEDDVSQYGSEASADSPELRKCTSESSSTFVGHGDEKFLMKLLAKGLKHDRNLAVAYHEFCHYKGGKNPDQENYYREFIATFSQKNLANMLKEEWAHKLVKRKLKKEKKGSKEERKEQREQKWEEELQRALQVKANESQVVEDIPVATKIDAPLLEARAHNNGTEESEAKAAFHPDAKTKLQPQAVKQDKIDTVDDTVDATMNSQPEPPNSDDVVSNDKALEVATSANEASAQEQKQVLEVVTSADGTSGQEQKQVLEVATSADEASGQEQKQVLEVATSADEALCQEQKQEAKDAAQLAEEAAAEALAELDAVRAAAASEIVQAPQAGKLVLEFKISKLLLTYHCQTLASDIQDKLPREDACPQQEDAPLEDEDAPILQEDTPINSFCDCISLVEIQNEELSVGDCVRVRAAARSLKNRGRMGKVMEKSKKEPHWNVQFVDGSWPAHDWFNACDLERASPATDQKQEKSQDNLEKTEREEPTRTEPFVLMVGSPVCVRRSNTNFGTKTNGGRSGKIMQNMGNDRQWKVRFDDDRWPRTGVFATDDLELDTPTCSSRQVTELVTTAAASASSSSSRVPELRRPDRLQSAPAGQIGTALGALSEEDQKRRARLAWQPTPEQVKTIPRAEPKGAAQVEAPSQKVGASCSDLTTVPTASPVVHPTPPMTRSASAFARTNTMGLLRALTTKADSPEKQTWRGAGSELAAHMSRRLAQSEGGNSFTRMK